MKLSSYQLSGTNLFSFLGFSNCKPEILIFQENNAQICFVGRFLLLKLKVHFSKWKLTNITDLYDSVFWSSWKSYRKISYLYGNLLFENSWYPEFWIWKLDIFMTFAKLSLLIENADFDSFWDSHSFFFTPK